MDFASKFVYARKKNSQSESSIESEPDTNVICAKFDHLVETNNTHAGEPFLCQKCDAVFSKLSTLSNIDPILKKRVWKCEFCNFENKIMIDEEEIPKEEEVTYILETASENQAESNFDSKYIIYCIDISGSMSITTEVPGNFDLPTDNIRREALCGIIGENIHHYRGHVKHISRLEAVQVAIEDNLNKLEKNDPETKVGLVSFNQSVNIIGDGKMNLIKISNENIDSKTEIEKVADRTAEFEKIKNNKELLKSKLLNLEEGGATALGPALYYSVLVASRKKGSQVILCTDGLANKGIGSLENRNEQETNDFYNQVGDLALANGVSVSIITIEGTNCKLGLLGDITSKTGGIVNVVNPLSLKEQFSSILDEKVIATNVSASLILHQALYIRDHENINNRLSTITKEIGNVTKYTEITFEFAVRDDLEITNKELPFQLKITYTALNGTKCLRVLTKHKTVTDDKNIAERFSDRKILASNVVQTQTKLLKFNSEMSNFKNYSHYIRNIKPLEEDEFSEEAYNNMEKELNITPTHPRSMFGATAQSSMANRFSALPDADASRLYQMSKTRTKDLKKENKK